MGKMTMKQLYEDFGLVPDTHQFISHAMCLQLDEQHMDEPALPTVQALQVLLFACEVRDVTIHLPIVWVGWLTRGFLTYMRNSWWNIYAQPRCRRNFVQ